MKYGDTATLDRLQKYMNTLVDDDQISNGVELGKLGYQKVAAHMGVSVSDARNLLNSLIARTREQKQRAGDYEATVIEGADDRYGYEKDGLGNITINDGQTGDSKFLRGTDAGEVLAALKSGEPEQAVLAHFMQHDNLTEDEGDSYNDEISTDNGTYNFSWKKGGKHGTATASYNGKGNIQVISVRDENGNEINADSGFLSDLVQQAIEFIPEV